MRGGEKKDNNQRWPMGYGEGKRRGEEIAMMIAVSETASMTTMRTTECGAKEEVTVCHMAAPAVDASPCPPSLCVPYSRSY
jgi:hypothetical protein